ncbi:MAG: J domain-containing protein [Firmicutes bacterium]|nr:J domain-containing protein [Bacillota bacterium]
MDPYEVLGLSRGATDEEIKNAYRELVKKYHPDKYIDNPLADLAEEKMREVNEAYDMLMKPTTTTTSSYSGSSSSYGGSSYSGSSYGGATYGTGTYYENATYGAGYDTHYAESGSHDYYEIRNAIDSNKFGLAQQLLSAKRDRTAEWYFLSGVLNYKIGYFDTAMQQIRRAISMAPQNQEYQDVYRKISGTGAIYKTTSYNRGYSSPSCLDCAMCYCLGNAFCC